MRETEFANLEICNDLGSGVRLSLALGTVKPHSILRGGTLILIDLTIGKKFGLSNKGKSHVTYRVGPCPNPWQYNRKNRMPIRPTPLDPPASKWCQCALPAQIHRSSGARRSY